MSRLINLTALVVLSLLAFVGCDKNINDPDPEPQYSSVILHGKTIKSQYLNGDLGTYNIYLPSDWETSGKKYPVLYLFHGMSGDNTDWTKNQVQSMTDQSINDGKLTPYIIVMPKAYNSFYVDGLYGTDAVMHNYESFFWKELVPHIESTYPVMTDKAHTAISGLSMGGFGCSYYAFKYPQRFAMCYAMSGALEGAGNALTPSVQTMFGTFGYNKDNFNTLPAYFMDCGTEDYLCKTANDNTDLFLTSIGFDHHYIQDSGTHDWTYWKKCYKRLMKRLEAYFPAN